MTDPIENEDTAAAAPEEDQVPPRRSTNLILPGLVGVVALGGGVLLGPRPVVDPTLRPIELPGELDGDLETWLRVREADLGDVEPFARKSIRWLDPSTRARTPLSLVYLHGFSASRQEIAPVPERVARSLGANLFETRLRGHGRRDPDAMAEATVNDWLHDAVEALEIGRRLGDRVIVLGVSTGGTLATWLAAERAADVHALVLVSPNYRLRDPKAIALGWPWGGHLARLALGERRSIRVSNRIQDRYWTTSYPTSTLITLIGLMQWVEEVPGEDVRVPTLVLADPEDSVISPEAARERFSRFAGEPKRFVDFRSEDPGRHVLAGDALSPGTTEEAVAEIVGFVESLGGGPGRGAEGGGRE